MSAIGCDVMPLKIVHLTSDRRDVPAQFVCDTKWCQHKFYRQLSVKYVVEQVPN